MNFKKLDTKTFSAAIFKLKGISKKTIDAHLKLYQGYINKYNEINEKLMALDDEQYAKANQVYSAVRELKVELSFAWGGIINHEIYFQHLGGSGDKPQGKLAKQIDKDFGSYDDYIKDMLATGMSARGWAWTAWNEKEKKLFNYLGDSQNTYALWFAKPIVALDVYEHAYFMDYGTNRADYINAFFSNLDWNIVEKNFDL